MSSNGQSGQNRRMEPVTTGLVVAVAALVAVAGYLFTEVRGLRAELQGLQEVVTTDVGALRETVSLNQGSAVRDAQSLREQLEAAQAEAQAAVGQAKVDAQRHADKLAKELAQQQKTYQAEVQGEFGAVRGEVREAADAAAAQITEVSAEVDNVESAVKLTRSELDKTISDLKRVNGDMGVMSGLIATNSSELSALRELGERNYIEFRLPKSKQPQRIGDIRATLKKADPKKNRFTLELVADDKRIEKKDKTVNEPVQFYTAGQRQPLELVVFQVSKDEIKGYLSTPKVLVAANHGPALQ